MNQRLSHFLVPNWNRIGETFVWARYLFESGFLRIKSMSEMRVAIVSMVLILTGGCSFVSKAKHEKALARLALLEEKNEKQLELIEELFNRQEALVRSLAQTENRRGEELNRGVPVSKPNEISLYSKIIAFYREKSIVNLQRVTQMLKKVYPESIYLDNAYFLNARLNFDQERWADAKEWVYRIESNFPYSSKLSAAKLLNARIESRLGAKDRALRLFQEVQSEFPESPEAHQAVLEEARLRGQS